MQVIVCLDEIINYIIYMLRLSKLALRAFASSKTVDVLFVEEAVPKQIKVKASVGSSILEVARSNNVQLEGACEGGCACATCHVIIDKEHYNTFHKPEQNEEDCLDNAFGLTNTSRLGCQTIITDKCGGCTITIPSATRNVNFKK